MCSTGHSRHSAARPSEGTPVITDIPVFPDIPDIPVIPVFPDIPVIPDTPETFQSLMSFQPLQAILQVPVSPGNPPHSSILRLECIFYKFYSSIGFHRKPIGQLQTTNIHSSKKGRCCDIGQMCIGKDVKMTYFLE